MLAQLLVAVLVTSSPLDGGTPTSDAGVSDQFPKAADGTPMVLPDGDANPAYYNPPKTYRSTEGFQVVRWGMTRKEVKRLVKGLRPDDDDLVGAATVAGLRSVIFYSFADDRLAKVVVLATPAGPEAGDFHDAFAQINRGLQAKYGDPHYDREKWTNTLFKDGGMADFERALALGHVIPESTWQNGESEITLTTRVAELTRVVVVRYRSRRLEDALQAANERAAKKAEQDAAADL